jgi:hypothetical protein
VMWDFAMLRKANGTIDISSALTALKAALFFDGVVIFVSSIGTA